MIDSTTVNRRIEGSVDTQTEQDVLADVRIEVESFDDEEARELADEIAQAVHGVVDNE